jgi:hypothetical protein
MHKGAQLENLGEGSESFRAKIISQEEEDVVCQISLYRMAKKKD